MKERDILYEHGEYFVIRGPRGKGFEVYQTGTTHAVRRAQIGFEGQRGFDRAKQEIARREAEKVSLDHVIRGA